MYVCMGWRYKILGVKKIKKQSDNCYISVHGLMMLIIENPHYMLGIRKQAINHVGNYFQSLQFKGEENIVLLTRKLYRI